MEIADSHTVRRQAQPEAVMAYPEGIERLVVHKRNDQHRYAEKDTLFDAA
jgi:hypothetical protein